MSWGIFGVVLGRAVLEAVPGSSQVLVLVFLGKCAGSECSSFLCSQIPAAEDYVHGSIVGNKKQGWTWSDNLLFLQRICQSCFETCEFIRL